MAKHTILFVDDEVLLLRAIQYELRPYSDRLDVTFADGGEQALKHLCERPFDILITDMVMPGIDGATLLRRASEQWPSMIRIVLSGHPEFEQAIRSVPYAHQRLRKPWTRDELMATLNRACGLSSVVSNASLRASINRIGTLPSSMDSYMRLLWAIDNRNANFASVAAVIEQDTAMSARLLQLANSAFVAPRSKVMSVQSAVSTIGLEAIRQYLLSPFLNVFDVYTPVREAQGSSFKRIERHARFVATLTRELAQGSSFGTKGYLAGMMHDIGRLFLLASMPDVFEELEQEAAGKDCPVHQLEVRRLSVHHADIGAYLLSLWGIPDELVTAVARHHERGAGTPGEIASLLRLADWLALEHEAQEARPGLPEGIVLLEFDQALLRSLGLMDEIPRLLGLAARCADESQKQIKEPALNALP